MEDNFDTKSLNYILGEMSQSLKFIKKELNKQGTDFKEFKRCIEKELDDVKTNNAFIKGKLAVWLALISTFSASVIASIVAFFTNK